MRGAVWSKRKNMCGKELTVLLTTILAATSEIWCSQHKVRQVELIFQGHCFLHFSHLPLMY